MLKVRKILLPVEFHETTLRVIGVVDSIARRFGSEIVLLHVLAPESYSKQEWKNGRPVTGEDLLEELFAYAEQLGEKLPGLEGLPVKCVVRRGDASSEIIEAARHELVDLIAMATRGRAGFYGHLIGSVTAKVMHESEAPVLTGTRFPEVPQQGLSVKRVLCGVTFSEHSLATLECAAKIAAEFQAQLSIAHVTPNVDLYGPGGTYAERRWQQELVASGEELIAKVQEQTGVKGEAAVESGDPGAGLSRIADRVSADLLVVGAHFGGGHLGANGHGILAESKIPVLSL
jgi:nucleotide-binding universal stress UspA family protein